MKNRLPSLVEVCAEQRAENWREADAQRDHRAALSAARKSAATKKARRLTQEHRERVRVLWGQGVSISRIAVVCGIGRATVRRALDSANRSQHCTPSSLTGPAFSEHRVGQQRRCA